MLRASSISSEPLSHPHQVTQHPAPHPSSIPDQYGFRDPRVQRRSAGAPELRGLQGLPVHGLIAGAEPHLRRGPH